jgi:hypothetical protein
MNPAMKRVFLACGMLCCGGPLAAVTAQGVEADGLIFNRAGAFWRGGASPSAMQGRRDRRALAAAEDRTEYRIESEPVRRIRAILTNDISLPNGRATIWEAMAFPAPTLSGQREVRTTFTAGGQPARERGPSQRRVLVSRVTGRPKELHTRLTIEATLYARRLRRRPPGPAPEVPDLPKATARLYTRPTSTLDFDAEPFQDWLNENGLWRGREESDLAFARRVFADLRQRLEYVAHPSDLQASSLCGAGHSDCAGQSCLFVAVLRANAVPARLLQGRWAVSEGPGKTYGERYGKFHVKSEFFARGIGWVPVDLAAASQDRTRGELAYFGNDSGDFLDMNVDQDIVLESTFGDSRIVFGMQRIAYWWRGSGSAKGERVGEHWRVEEQEAP